VTLCAQLLRALRDVPNGVSGTDLARTLGISRAAVWARFDELRALGYEIVASPHNGYRLVGTPDLLDSDDIQARLPVNHVIGREIRVYAKTTSTNDLVGRLCRDGAREGVVIFAEAQTKGRGRQGRTWVSPAGKGLWFSILLRPRASLQAATQLTVAAATALLRAVEAQTGVAASIKWPNDLLAGGRKLAGILTEISAEAGGSQGAVVGIGLNVNITAPEFPAELRERVTSLKIETGRDINRGDLAVAILGELDRDYGKIQEGRFEEIAEEWRERCGTIGREVRIRAGGRIIAGRAESLDSEGALLVRTRHGLLERVLSGDVELG